MFYLVDWYSHKLLMISNSETNVEEARVEVERRWGRYYLLSIFYGTFECPVTYLDKRDVCERYKNPLTLSGS